MYAFGSNTIPCDFETLTLPLSTDAHPERGGERDKTNNNNTKKKGGGTTTTKHPL